MQAAHRVAKNTAILYGRMAITVFISLYGTRLILSALGAADFGLFNVVGGLIAMLGFLNDSMTAATQRFMSFAQGSGDLEKVKRIFNMSTILHIGIAIILVLILEIAGFFFFHGVLNILPNRINVARLIYQFMVVSTFFTVISVPYDAVITSHENMVLYAILGIVESLLKLSIAFYITYSTSDHLVVYGILMAILSVLLLVAKRIYCQKKYVECTISFRNYYDKPLLKELASFAGWSLLGSSSSMVAFYGQGIIINIFFGTVVNAAQGIAAQISGQLGVFATRLMNALNPIIDKSEGAGNRQLMLKATMMGSKISFFMLGILYIPFLLEMPKLLELWLGKIPEYTIVFCRLLLIRNLVEQFYIPIITSINAVGKIAKFQKVSAFLNISPLITSYFCFSYGYSPTSLYIIYLCYSLLMFCSVLYYAKKYCDLLILFFLKNVVLKCLIVFLLSMLFSSLIYSSFTYSLIRLIGVFISSIGSYLFFVWIIGLSNEEQDFIKKIFNLLHNRVIEMLPSNKFMKVH